VRIVGSTLKPDISNVQGEKVGVDVSIRGDLEGFWGAGIEVLEA
jgi:hypothetical protein